MRNLTAPLFKDKKIRCPSCIFEIYAGDCPILATADPYADVSPGIVPNTITTKPVPPSPGTNLRTKLVRIEKNTLLKKAPLDNTREQSRARMNPEPLDRELYTLCEARRVCPLCGYYLPVNFDSVKSKTIAIVGDNYSGKSHYIAALIKQLQAKKFLDAKLGLTFTCLTPDIENFYVTNYFEPLFNNKHKLAPSQKSTEITHTPLIYEMSMQPTRQRPIKTLNLVIYDTAGEDYMIQQRLVRYARYALSADAIIFLADPISIPEILDNLPHDADYINVPKRTANRGLEQLIASVKNFKGVDNFRSVPMAITLSKADLLKYLVPLSGHYYFMLPHEYTGTVSLSELERINSEVKDFITRFGDSALLHTVAFFEKVSFFATSATGYAPNDQGVFPAVVPQRCLDPLLWILHELKILPKDELF
jgi:GTPase SAR1 family protein